MPPSLHDWLPQDHLAWFVLAAVEQMDLSAFYADYRADGHGRAAHEPAMMLALLLYGYAKGQRSSRVIGQTSVPITRRSRAFESATRRRSRACSRRSCRSVAMPGCSRAA